MTPFELCAPSIHSGDESQLQSRREDNGVHLIDPLELFPITSLLVVECFFKFGVSVELLVRWSSLDLQRQKKCK